jgi:ribose 5-phosphate isomerase B
MGANYEGYELGRQLEAHLRDVGHEVIWHGADAYDFEDDYPLFSMRVGQAVIVDEDNALEVRGIVVGGSGAGEVIASNKVNGARAISSISTAYVTHAREHVNANILAVGAAFTSLEDAKEQIDALMNTKFLNKLDDARRIINTNEFENSGTIEGWMINY